MSFVHMAVEEMDQAMADLAAAGTGFDRAWSAAGPAIAGLAGGLGQGPMGQAFMTGYRPAAHISDSAATRQKASR